MCGRDVIAPSGGGAAARSVAAPLESGLGPTSTVRASLRHVLNIGRDVPCYGDVSACSVLQLTVLTSAGRRVGEAGGSAARRCEGCERWAVSGER